LSTTGIFEFVIVAAYVVAHWLSSYFCLLALPFLWLFNISLVSIGCRFKDQRCV